MAVSATLAPETTDIARTRLVEFRVLGSATGATDVSVRVNGDEPIDLGPVTQIDTVVQIRDGRNTIALVATDGIDTDTDVHAVDLIQGVRPDDSRNIARLIPRSLRLGGPEGRGINRVVEAVSEAVARVHSVLRAKAASLRDVHSPRRIPARFARELAWNVGFDDGLALTGYLTTEDEWRRAAEIAMQVWKTKGAQPSYRDIERAKTGARIWIGDWFGLRTLAGLSGFPWYGTALNGAYSTHVHVEDIDGTLNRDKALEALNTVRPFGEEIVCTFVNLIESWDNIFRWDTSGPATLGDQRLLLQGASAVRLIDEIDGSAWDKVAYVTIAHISQGDSLQIVFRWDVSGGTFYALTVTEGGGGTVTLERFDGGFTTLASVSAAVRRRPAAATGTITTVAGALLVDGETVVINDGVGTTTTFELDDDGAVTPGNVDVPFTASDTTDQVRNALIERINRTPSLRVSSDIGGSALVDLTHDFNTAQANVPITETVADAGFAVTGMAGGIDEWGARIDIQVFPSIGPSLQFKVLVDGVELFTAADASPLPTGTTSFTTTGFVDVLYHEVLPLEGQDIRTIP